MKSSVGHLIGQAFAMSNYAKVLLSDGRLAMSFRHGFDPLFLLLFTKENQVSFAGASAVALNADLYEEKDRVIGFNAPVGELVDRLNLLGVTQDDLESAFLGVIAEHLRFRSWFDDRYSSDSGGTVEAFRAEETRTIKSLTWADWLGGTKDGLERGLDGSKRGMFDLSSPAWFLNLWEDQDPRLHFRALLAALPNDEVITLDLAELGEDFTDDLPDLQALARNHVAYTSGAGLTPIVLTEGVFDVEVLAASIRIRRPHLADLIRLPDFSSKPEGSAAALRQTIRAFASAGIPNRVVALFDNDAAAREAVRPIQVPLLPPNLTVTFLPRLQLASNYPTIGPQGLSAQDVNGLAGSIEMYLGEDVLRVEGSLVPIKWGGLMKGLNEYQGALVDKPGVQNRWRSKVEAAESDSSVVESQDWSGIDLILDHITTIIGQLKIDPQLALAGPYLD